MRTRFPDSQFWQVLPRLILLMLLINVCHCHISPHPIHDGTGEISENLQPIHEIQEGQQLQEPANKPAESNGSNDDTGAPEENNSTDSGDRRQQLAEDEYLVGVGIADITGPAADINLVSLIRQLLGYPTAGPLLTPLGLLSGMVDDQQQIIQIHRPSLDELTDMGYAKPNQDAGGIHLRQFSRSVIVEDPTGRRLLYTSIDSGMISQLLRIRLLKRLQLIFGPLIYHEQNTMLTASHSHSCPGGFFQYMLYNIPSSGFISQTLESLLDGMERSIKRAHSNMRPARLYYNQGELLDAAINRSPTAYDNNPLEERARYQHNTDTTMQTLKAIHSDTGKPIALISWFPVHATSMNYTNHLISSDNKGYASILMEREFGGEKLDKNRVDFVAVFAQANEGDVSPNILGSRCHESGLPCEPASSTCKNPHERCVSVGPGKDMFDSTRIIGERQFLKAKQLMTEDNSRQEQVRGPIEYVHEHIDMAQQVVPAYGAALLLASQRRRLRARNKDEPVAVSGARGGPAEPENYHTCPAALGYSFAAGTTDGSGEFDFQQGEMVSPRYWNLLRDCVRRPSNEQMRCHRPKPIFISTGEMDFPYSWHPRIVPTQILTIGQLVVVGLPGEFTTMAGRRVRAAVQKVLERVSSSEGLKQHRFVTEQLKMTASDEPENGKPALIGQKVSTKWALKAPRIILSGLSNIYTSYITTIEEYEMQRYEAASTLYGPHTLQAYVNQFKRLALLLATGTKPAADQPTPPDLSKSLFSLKTGVIFDSAPHGKSFGDTIVDVNPDKVYKCSDLVSVSFVAGHPRNDLRQEDSFLYVQRYIGNGTWETVATDSAWETKFIWQRTSTVLGESKATIEWEIPTKCKTGLYRILHFGSHKNIFQTVNQYSGMSSPFKVIAEMDREVQQDEHVAKPTDNLHVIDDPSMIISSTTRSPGISNEFGQEQDRAPKRRDSGSAYKRGFAFLSSVIKRFL